MKIERIDSNRIKVTYSAKDLDSRGIRIQDLAPDSEKYQELIYDVIDHAEIEMGDEGLGQHIIVESTSYVNGGCSVIITRDDSSGAPSGRSDGRQDGHIDSQGGYQIDGQNVLNNFLNMLFNAVDIELQDDSGKFENISEQRVITFTNLEDLLSACRMCKNPNEIPSKLYTFDDKYGLIITVNRKNSRAVKAFEALAAEYGGMVFESADIMPVINERGKRLIGRSAIASLPKKFGV